MTILLMRLPSLTVVSKLAAAFLLLLHGEMIVNVSHSRAAQIVADTSGLDTFTTPSFFGVEFLSGSPSEFVRSVMFHIDVNPGAHFDFGGSGSFENATEPVLGRLVGIDSSDVDYDFLAPVSFDPSRPARLRINFAPGSFGVGDSLRFAADTDNFFLGSPTRGGDFGAAGASISVAMSDGGFGRSLFEAVSLTRSEATVVPAPGPTARIIDLRHNSLNLPPEIAPNPLADGAYVHPDRSFIYTNVPARLENLQYVLIANDDKTVPDFEMSFDINSDVFAYLLLDWGIGDNNRSDPPTLGSAGSGAMPWVLDDGWTNTGLHIDVNELSFGIRRSAVYFKPFETGSTVNLFEQNNGFQSRSMYAVAVASNVRGDTFPFDGIVDIDDLNSIRNNFGRRGPRNGSLVGDTFPFDGFVDITDLNTVRNNFGAGATAVPEPATAALFLLPACLCLARRRDA